MTEPGSAARPACPECGYRDNYTADDRWWHCRGCGHSWRPGHIPWEHRLSAFLAIKLGRRPGDATLEYMAEWAPRESLRREAARVLAKRKARNV